MSDARLLHRLDDVAQRLRKLRSLKVAVVLWSMLALLAITLWWTEASRMITFTTLGVGAIIAFSVSMLAGRKRSGDRTEAALRIEAAHPDLDSRLITAVQQKPNSENWEFGYLQTEVLSEVLTHSRSTSWNDSVPGKTLAAFQIPTLMAMLCCVVISLLMLRGPNAVTEQTPSANNALATVNNQGFQISVEPGDAEVERGTSLLVMARFDEAVPSEVRLVATDSQGQEFQVPLKKSLDDPLFGGRIPDVQRDLTYRVEFDSNNSDDFQVTAFDYPTLLKADAVIDYPTYTKLEPEELKDVRRFSLVEGSTIQLDCELNKPVKDASLVDEEGNTLPLIANAETPQELTLAWSPKLKGTQTYRLELRDVDGRQNREPTEFVVQVLPNNPPSLKVAFPKKDIRVSPLQEVSLQADASDDFGLLEYGLVYQKPDGTEESVQLGEKLDRDDVVAMQHLLALETMKVVPDELLSYYFYADDVGPDGNPRRTFSDMFFAEVRPFEETFRQMPPAKGEGKPPQKLLDLQRQVVSGSWNLIRLEPQDPVGSQFKEQSQTLADSQAEIIKLAEQVQAKLTDELQKQYMQAALAAMAVAQEKFATATSDNSIALLPEGRIAAQKAYQALLKLQSREKKLQKSKGQSKESADQKKLNQQLNALELKNDRDRYGTEKQAKREQDEANRELLQVLNRLRELARRQEDLNEKVRELENALRNANSEQEKQELQRRLKRLQEEQEELLRNADELKERMNSEQNRTRMADARDQVEKTRERMLRSSESLKQQQTSRALTEGTRAERELEQLKEEFRKQTAGQFGDAVRELRNEVRELAESQTELRQELKGSAEPQDAPKRNSLRETTQIPNREELSHKFQTQKEQLSQVLDQTAQLVQEAENTEPLLAKRLYDAVRDLRKYQPEESLENAARLTRYGITAEAEKLEQRAADGIERLQEGVEAAAESILGNEADALAMANEELKALSDSIKNELEKKNPQGRESGKNDPSTAKDSSGEPMEDGQQRQGQKSPNGTKQGAQGQQGESPAKTPGQGQNPSEQSGAGKSPSEKTGLGSEGKSGKAGQSQQQGSSPGKGQQPGQSPSQSSQGQQGKGKSSGQSKSSGEGKGQSKGKGEGEGQVKGKEKAGKPSSSSQQSGQPSQGGSPSGSPSQGGSTSPNNSGGGFGPHNPLTGDEFVEWSDRMRDVEEVISNPDLQAQIAMIRDRARQVRIDVKRHSKQPDWEMVRTSIYGPMLELQKQVEEELDRLNPNKNLVPIDRDPVPEAYSELLEKYYEQLSKQR